MTPLEVYELMLEAYEDAQRNYEATMAGLPAGFPWKIAEPVKPSLPTVQTRQFKKRTSVSIGEKLGMGK